MLPEFRFLLLLLRLPACVLSDGTSTLLVRYRPYASWGKSCKVFFYGVEDDGDGNDDDDVSFGVDPG